MLFTRPAGQPPPFLYSFAWSPPVRLPHWKPPWISIPASTSPRSKRLAHAGRWTGRTSPVTPHQRHAGGAHRPGPGRRVAASEALKLSPITVEADLYMVWHLVTEERTDVRTYNSMSYYNCWGCGPAGIRCERAPVHSRARFIVDMIDPLSAASRCGARLSSLSLRNQPEDPEVLAEERREAATAVFADFPPKLRCAALARCTPHKPDRRASAGQRLLGHNFEAVPLVQAARSIRWSFPGRRAYVLLVAHARALLEHGRAQALALCRLAAAHEHQMIMRCFRVSDGQKSAPCCGMSPQRPFWPLCVAIALATRLREGKAGRNVKGCRRAAARDHGRSLIRSPCAGCPGAGICP